MRYGSICSGIEAASVAWHPLGWEPAWFSEIDTFPSAVLNHRFPGVPNHGDFTQILRDESHPARSVPIDVLVGGTPCQAFSVAGLRRGFDDDRGNLTLEFCRLVGLLRPKWVVWENVPGVLSIDGGRAFGSILGAFRELGYGFAYRILDAQHFGVPQRRRRIFLVGHSGGDWRAPATVLFEPEGVFGNPPPSAKTRKVAPRSTGNGAPSDSQRVMRRVAIGEYTEDEVACTQNARDYKDGSDLVVHDGFVPHVAPTVTSKWSKGSGGPAGDEVQNLVVAPMSPQALHDPCNTLDASYYKGPGMLGGTERNIVVFRAPSIGEFKESPIADTLIKNSGAGNGETQNPAFVLHTDVIAFHPTQDPISSEGRTHALSAGSKQGTASVAVAIPIGFYTTAGAHSVNAVEDGTPTLKCDGWGPLSVSFRANMGGNDGAVYEDGTCGTLTGNTQPAVTLIRESGQGYWMEDAVAGTVDAHVGMSGSGALRPGVLAFRPAYFLREGASGAPSEISGTVLASNAKNGDTADHVFAFKPSHYTRGKDGAPSEITPPLSADADKGDQDTVVLARTVDTRAGRSGANTFALSGGLVPVRATVPVAPTLSARRTAGGGLGSDFDYDGGLIIEPKAIAVALRGREGGYTAELGDDKANALRAGDGGGSKAFVFCDVYNGKIDGEVAATLTIAAGTSANHSGPTIMSFAENQRVDLRESETATALTTGGGKPSEGYPAVRVDHAVRRLTPVECERLQGFPDGWTQVPFRNKPAADGPRYKALGNSMAVPVMRWIGSRIAKVDALLRTV